MGGEGVWGGEILSIQNRKQNLYAKHQDEIHLNFSFCFEKRLFKFSLRLLLVKIMCRLQKLPMYSVFWQMSPFHNSPEWFMMLNASRLPPVLDMTSQLCHIPRHSTAYLQEQRIWVSFLQVLIKSALSSFWASTSATWHDGTMARWHSDMIKIIFLHFSNSFYLFIYLDFQVGHVKILLFRKLFADKFDVQVAVHRDKFL